MKGLVYHGPGQRSWDEVPDPTIEVPTDVARAFQHERAEGAVVRRVVGDAFEVMHILRLEWPQLGEAPGLFDAGE